MKTGLLLLVGLLGSLVLIWPGRGLLARWRRAQTLARRSRQEDALKHILKSEANARLATLDSLAGALRITTAAAAALLDELLNAGLLTLEGGELRLQPAGREVALHVVRAHRLWESYLAEETGVAESEWHALAERKEHLLTRQETDALAARLGYPAHDPHGDAIPGKDGTLEGDAGLPLNSVPPETPVVITHLEDEPETVYRQLLALGLRPGMRAFVLEKSANRIRFWADGNEHVLAPVCAQSVSIKPLPKLHRQDLERDTFLSDLTRGHRSRVIGITAACRGPERRRLLDLGFVPGTCVEVERISPAGDPTAYRVRGTSIALRREQANLVRIEPPEETRP